MVAMAVDSADHLRVESFDLGLIALFVVAFGLVSGLAARSLISGAMAFVAFGMLIGPAGLDILGLELDNAILEVLAEVTLAVVLFTDATRIDLRVARTGAQLPGRLLGIGMPLTVLAGIGAGMVLLTDLSMWEMALLAALLAPTDAALGQAVVTDESIPVRIRQALNVESGLNDGIAAPLVTVFLAVAAVEIDSGDTGTWVQFAGQQIGYGLLIGVASGLAGGWLMRTRTELGWVTGTFRQLATLAVALTAFGLAGAAGGNGFVAAFTAGVAFGLVAREECPHIEDFTEDEGQLLALLTFLFFGATLAGPALGDITWEILAYSVLSLTLLRALPVALSLLGSGLRVETIGFLAWFGPRGLASIAFLVMVLEEAALPGGDTIRLTVTCTVVLSVFAHGISARPWARSYGRRMSAAAEHHDDMPETQPVPDIRPRLTHRPTSDSG